MQNENSPESRFFVLKAIYDFSKCDIHKSIKYEEVKRTIKFESENLSAILIYLNERNLIKIGINYFNITVQGIDEIEKSRDIHIPKNIYYNTFNAAVNGIQQGGQDNEQNIVESQINRDLSIVRATSFWEIKQLSIIKPVLLNTFKEPSLFVENRIINQQKNVYKFLYPITVKLNIFLRYACVGFYSASCDLGERLYEKGLFIDGWFLFVNGQIHTFKKETKFFQTSQDSINDSLEVLRHLQ